MRILITFFLLFTLTNYSVAQTKQDTLDLLERKAVDYLKEMYVEQAFDKAFEKWYDSILVEIEDLYNRKHDIIFLTNTDLIREIQTDFKKFYLKSKQFTILKFNDRDLSHEGNNITGLFEYSYSEVINSLLKKEKSFLYIIYDKGKSEWRLIDFRIPEILGGDLKEWMK